ncbi:MAG TPA: hypothetical protein VHB20_11850 [Verrucomicrobiae bacterium]|jgi:uncharacterized protein involved in exopolysaccharide biosynthesis/Mrp family chromosome partitioning ATPase|nr:hypothetical protein [Verrucomicrobiae bacterium]
MNQKKTAPQPTITLGDVYYVIFRRKWLILTISLLSIVAAVAVYLKYPFPYTSQAKLYIRYVPDAGNDLMGEAQGRTIDKQGNNVLNSELEMLTTWNLAVKAAEAVGPARITGKKNLTNAESAAGFIINHLHADLPKNDDVITLTFDHPDPAVAQPVLTELIHAYRSKNLDLFSKNTQSQDILSQQVDLARGRLSEAERQYHEKMNSIGALDLEDTKKEYTAQISRLNQSLVDAQAELAQARATMGELQKHFPQAAAVNTNLTNVAATANAPVPPGTVLEYDQLCKNLETMEEEQTARLAVYTTNSPLVQTAAIGIERAQQRKEKLETAWPALAVAKTIERTMPSLGNATLTPQQQMDDTVLKAQGYIARINILSNALTEVRSNITAINLAEAPIAEAMRTKEIEEANFKRLFDSYNKAKLTEAYGPGQLSGIDEAESPTPPSRDSKKIIKTVGGIMFGGIAFAFALAFFIEMGLNRAFRHAGEVESKLGLPFFISVPKLNGAHQKRLASGQVPLLCEGEKAPEAAMAAAMVSGNINGVKQQAELQPFYETLRDRLIAYFEMINLTHKPKLVAVTSCNHGAGVTSTAAGLAASLSETGDGNVLLVNMSAQGGEGEAHHFYKGRLSCVLDEVLDKGKRDEARVQDNLYVAKDFAAGDALPRGFPKRFSNLVPRMKASDFDYIIFDMPPVSQISITPRLARFMDMVLLVIEAGITDRDVAQRTAAMLGDSKGNVGVILNKTRSYVPQRLVADI